jgi:hypothetical protein
LARSGQLQICSGTQSAEEAGLQEFYVTGARVPKGHWRTASAAEAASLAAGAADSPPGETLEFLSVTTGPALVRARPALDLGHTFTTVPAGDSDTWNLLTKSAPELLQAVTSARGRAFHLASKASVAFDDPQLITTTRDPGRRNQLLGLHVDSQERKALNERDTCLRLLSFNIATEPRWLLFVKESVRSIALMLSESGRADACRAGATSAGAAFLAGATGCPVFRLRLDPGQGYLGPVQNMVHDGSTAGANSMGLRVCAFGHFA